MKRVFGLVLGVGILTASANAAMVPALTDIKANGVTNATAAHGVFRGNDADGTGNPLLGWLNNGGTATYAGDGVVAPGTTVTFSATGMFSTAGLPDTRVGAAMGDVPWFYRGKSDDPNNGPFSSWDQMTTGTLVLDAPINGDVVISLKGGPEFAVYAFKGLVNVTSFTFDISSTLGAALSHAALYSAVPEPTTFALFGLGTLGLGVVRRRKTV